MTSNRIDTVKDLFDRLRLLGPESRSEALALLRADEQMALLVPDVELLLAALDDAGAFLESPTGGGTSRLGCPPDGALPTDEGVGSQIGSYTLTKLVGEGGFGLVYEAEQIQPIRRIVALKVIKPGMDTRQVRTRFSAERQTLALMEHPSIARVIDAGSTPSGRPYFAMELVNGRRITQYCDERGLGVRQRLELFGNVCLAVQHAHQKGVIHRDLKPSNILVEPHEPDGEPIPKIIDFGVAKALGSEPDSTEKPTVGDAFAGTPGYMSPEQIGATDHAPDARTDIYSLGVVLFELLTGAMPFDRKRLGTIDLLEQYRQIRESDPPRPSNRLQQMESETSAAIAVVRGTDAATLARQIRGDLDWIVLTAMAREPALRYASASEFAADITRHLRGEPVLARPQSIGYKIGKFVRRNRAAVVAAAAAGATIICGTIAIFFALVEARAQRAVADRRAYTATIAAASSALEVGDATLAREYLARIPKHSRGWEWRHYDSRLNESVYAINAHAGHITAIAMAGDGSRIVSSGTDGRLRAWDSQGRMTLDKAAGARTCSVSPDGTRMLTDEGFEDPDGVGVHVVLRDVTTGEEQWRLVGAMSSDQAFAPDGKSISVAIPAERAVARVDAGTGAVIEMYRLEDDSPVYAAMTADDSIAFVTSDKGKEGIAGLFAADGGRTLLPGKGVFYRPLFTGRSPLLLYDNWVDGRVGYADLRTGQHMDIPARQGHERYPLAITDDERWLAIGEGERVLIWDMPNRQQAVVLHGHASIVTKGRFSPGGDVLVTGDEGGVIRVWALPAIASPMQVARWEHWPQYAAALSPCGSFLATGGWSFVRLWNPASGVIHRTSDADRGYVEQLAFSPSGRSLAVSGLYCRLHVRDVETGQVMIQTDLSGDGPMIWTPNGSCVIRIDDLGQLQIVHVEKGVTEELVVFSAARLQGIAAAGEHLALLAMAESTSPGDGGQDGRTHQAVLALWNLEDRRILRQWTLDGVRTPVLAVDSTGRHAAVGGSDGSVQLWDLQRGRKLWTSEPGASAISRIAFSHAGDRLAVGRSTRIDLLHTEAGHTVAVLRHQVGKVVGLAFTPNDESLVVCGREHPFVIFDAAEVTPETRRLRSRFAAARAVADPLFDSLISSRRVAEQVGPAIAGSGGAEAPAPGWLAEAAADFATARGDHLAGLASDAALAFRYEQYERSLTMYQALREIAGGPVSVWDPFVAALQYRFGDFHVADPTCRSYMDWEQRPLTRAAADYAVMALIHRALEREPEAREAWRNATAAAQQYGVPADDLANSIWREAVSLFSDH
jgi:eukaryotic-like serine/threonine-protein kinase